MGPPANFNFQQAFTVNNQLSGWSYDAAGNLLSDGLGDNYTYNGEGMIISVSGTNYVYDGEGNRVEKSGSAATDYVYFGGHPLARLSGGNWTDLIYGAGGSLVAEVPGTQTGTPIYRMLDHLGTAVGTLSSTGVLLSTADYAPFGQTFSGGTADPYKFTGKERDTESGNDYFGVRYYGSNMARFLSPDPHSGSRSNPQSLNKYVYGANNPLRNIDPSGMDCVYAGSSAATSTIIRGDCVSDTDSGVFVDGHVDSIVDNADGASATIHWSDYTDANNPYNNPGNTSMFNAGSASTDPWGGHAFAQQVFQGPGSGNFVAANKAVTYAAAAYASAATAAFFAPAVVAGAEFVGGSLADGMFGSGLNNAFYSAGGNLADIGSALNTAEAAGQTTIDATPIGNLINSLTPNCGFCWNLASEGFASNTIGSATAYIGYGANLGSVFFQTELPILLGSGVAVTYSAIPR